MSECDPIPAEARNHSAEALNYSAEALNHSAEALNQRAGDLFDKGFKAASELGATAHDLSGAKVLDSGTGSNSKSRPGPLGGLEAGVVLAKLCLGNLACVDIVSASESMLVDQAVLVRTDHPVEACLGGQYAGWPLSVGDYFAMASGPMRMLRGREEMLQHLNLVRQSDQSASVAVGVLETDVLPTESVIASIADDCAVDLNQIRLAVAPSTSIAGCVQVVARSIETALHKLHALGFDVTKVISATGIAPLPPPAKPGDTIGGIGRTNDAMLYGSKVTLWIDHEDDAIEAVAAKVPSESSPDHGRPFADIFKQYDFDFYKVDPMLFSPAVVTIHSLRTGRTWQAGRLATHVLRLSFGMQS